MDEGVLSFVGDGVCFIWTIQKKLFRFGIIIYIKDNNNIV